MSTVDGDLLTGELGFVAARLAAAACPADVFGELTGAQDEQIARLRQQYRLLALAVHPDRHGNDPRANVAFVDLQRLYATALEQVKQGRYGQDAAPADAVVITTRRREYTVGGKLAEGDLADLYTCLITETGQQGGQQSAGILKIARDPEDNDLLFNEWLSLRYLLTDIGTDPIPAYIPRMLESFLYEDEDGVERQINAFPLALTERGPLPSDELFSLREVREQYRAGVDPRHMAWIWRRLLIALGHAHDREVIHGAVLPTHILIHPKQHALLLIDWCQSVQQPASSSGSHIPAISPEYERWYPPSVLAKSVPTPAVDLTMALRCMVYLLGGDPLTFAMPPGVPAPIQAYLQGALATVGQTHAWQLYQRFSDLMQSLWGQRRFIPFSMPARPHGGTAR